MSARNDNKKQRERKVCQCVADVINSTGGTDYRARSCDSDPPDVELVSESRGYPTREAEVVSTPQDHTIRSDNQNCDKFNSELKVELTARGINGCLIDVAWTKEVVRWGLRDWGPRIAQLADVAAERITSGRGIGGHLNIRKGALHNTAAYNAVDFISVSFVPQPVLQVDTCSGLLLPPDGRWIEDAIRKKSGRYSDRAAGKWILVIDGPLVDSEQVASFQAEHAQAQLPFAEIWLVTVFGVVRVRPS